MKKKYTKYTFFHGLNHRLNLVVSDASKLSDIRNTITTIKDTVSFFREFPALRNSVSILQRLYETG